MTENRSNIVQSSATGEEISGIILKLEDALDGTNRGHAIIALLSLVLVMMNPELTPEELRLGVRDTSQFICMVLEGYQHQSGHGDDTTSRILMN